MDIFQGPHERTHTTDDVMYYVPWIKLIKYYKDMWALRGHLHNIIEVDVPNFITYLSRTPKHE